MASDYGYKTPTHSAGSAGTVTASMLAANAGRRYAQFANNTAGTIYLALGGAAAINAGIRLNPAGSEGDCYEMTIGRGNIYTGAVHALHNDSSGTKVILITEGV